MWWFVVLWICGTLATASAIFALVKSWQNDCLGASKHDAMAVADIEEPIDEPQAW